MRRFIVILILILSVLSGNILANDSTLLYRQRLEQLKQFAAWLEEKPNVNIDLNNIDTTSAIWKLYDIAFDLFFDTRVMDSLFSLRTEVFDVSGKYGLMKIFISDYHQLVNKVPFDSIRFKSNPTKKNSTVESAYSARNTIDLYFLIDGKVYELFGFFFAENSPRLTGLTIMVSDETTAKAINNFIEKNKKKN